MEFTIVEGLKTLKFDLVFTLALAALFLYIGYALQRRIKFLARSSIPAPAVGGLLFALTLLLLHSRGTLGITIDSSLRAPLQTAFFTTIGLGATLALLRAGGWRMGFFWLIASMLAIVQNVVGLGLARAMNAPAPLGIICGALTLTGGPATGLARTGDFEQLGITGAGALIIASATFGIFMASLIGNPVATMLIRRFRLKAKREEHAGNRETEEFWAVGPVGEKETPPDIPRMEKNADEAQQPLTGLALLKTLMLILLIMGLGALIGMGMTRLGDTLPKNSTLAALLKLPGYIGAMIVAAIARNLDDRYGWLRIDARAVDALGTIALALFLVIALMDLKLWQLAGLAVPMLVILAVQVVVMIAYALMVTFVLMGRDYEAAVTASGHIGFGLGITPNAVANMEALTERYAPAPRSFLIVPVVGGFFIDVSNSLIINSSINLIS
ncbi:MAG TPA: sodium/glutamate symporter [Pyrinomonadaceae bacterium]|nr:sodium/glutamate symporter [Pyrinomonadaceae bacterium]